jgi:uncharacterized C2H2 Zn-finger protein
VTAHISAKEAKRLGIVATDPAPKAKVKVRRTAAGPYHTECARCGEEFHTQASETRHVVETHHARYRLVPGL